MQAALKETQNIQNLKLSNIESLMEQATGLDLNPANYLPNAPYIANLIRNINHTDNASDNASTLYNIYHQPSDFQSMQKHTTRNPMPKNNDFEVKLGLDQYIVDIDAAGYRAYSTLANHYRELAKELKQTANTKGKYAMSDAERIQTLAKANEYMEKYVDLKLKANKILKTEPPKHIQNTYKLSNYQNYVHSMYGGQAAKRKELRIHK